MARTGNPRIRELVAANRAAADAHALALCREHHLLDRHRRGLSLNAIAADLNRLGVPTARGGRWHKTSVRRLLERAEAHRPGRPLPLDPSEHRALGMAIRGFLLHDHPCVSRRRRERHREILRDLGLPETLGDVLALRARAEWEAVAAALSTSIQSSRADDASWLLLQRGLHERIRMRLEA